MINILVRQRRCLSEINIVTRHWLTLSSRFSLIRATLNSDITWSWSMRFGSSDHSWIQFNNAEFTFIGNNRHRHFRTRQRPYCWFSRCAVRCLRTGSSKLPGNVFLSLLSVSFTQEWVRSFFVNESWSHARKLLYLNECLTRQYLHSRSLIKQQVR